MSTPHRRPAKTDCYTSSSRNFSPKQSSNRNLQKRGSGICAFVQTIWRMLVNITALCLDHAYVCAVSWHILLLDLQFYFCFLPTTWFVVCLRYILAYVFFQIVMLTVLSFLQLLKLTSPKAESLLIQTHETGTCFQIQAQLYYAIYKVAGRHRTWRSYNRM